MVMKAATVELMDRQSDLHDAIFRAKTVEDKQRLNAEYDKTVSELIEILGEDAPCFEVDCTLWSLYSDVYKSHYNIRPRFRATRAEVLASLDGLKYHHISDCRYPQPQPETAMAIAFKAALAA